MSSPSGSAALKLKLKGLFCSPKLELVTVTTGLEFTFLKVYRLMALAPFESLTVISIVFDLLSSNSSNFALSMSIS